MANSKPLKQIVLSERAIAVFQRSPFSKLETLKDFEEFYKFLLANVMDNCAEQGLSVPHAMALMQIAGNLQKTKERQNAINQLARGISNSAQTKNNSTKLLSNFNRKPKVSFKDYSHE